jgi:hypothetical protein
MLTPKATTPARGVPGGWRDPWDAVDGLAALRAQAEAAARRQDEAAVILGAAWRAEIAAELDASRARPRGGRY